MAKTERVERDDLRPKRVKVKDKEMAKHDVKYKQVWKCPICKETRDFPKDAWDSWTKVQQDAYKAELDRQHLVHPGE